MQTEYGSPMPRSGHFLVCDDEKTVALQIKEELERRGYAVTCVFDGRDALEELKRQAFDGAIVDVMMPYVDGFQVLNWIRTHDESKGMWVAIATAMAVGGSGLESYRHMPDLFLSKPFDRDELH